jgi:hypothetical protein
MSRVLIDPTSEREATTRALTRRPATLDGKTVGLLNISKPRGDVFLDRVAERLTDRGIAIERFSKPTFTKPAPADLRREIEAKCDVVIEALAD